MREEEVWVSVVLFWRRSVKARWRQVWLVDESRFSKFFVALVRFELTEEMMQEFWRSLEKAWESEL